MNLFNSNPYNRTGYKPLPATFDADFLNHINHGLFDDLIEPVTWFAEVHEQFDAKMGRNEVSRHIVHAIKGTEFERIYSEK